MSLLLLLLSDRFCQSPSEKERKKTGSSRRARKQQCSGNHRHLKVGSSSSVCGNPSTQVMFFFSFHFLFLSVHTTNRVFAYGPSARQTGPMPVYISLWARGASTCCIDTDLALAITDQSHSTNTVVVVLNVRVNCWVEWSKGRT